MASLSSSPLANACTLFASTQCHGYSPIYEAVSHALAADDELLGLLSLAPRGQARPTLLLAAVHYLLLGGDDHPLGQFYPSVSNEPNTAADPKHLVTLFRSFCLDHRTALELLIQSGHTQTNDVRRTAALVLALQTIARSDATGLRLIEVGASAGLNLLYEQYGYHLGSMAVGNHRSGVDVRISVDHRIESRIENFLPRSTSVVGIDLAPIDVFDDNEVRWLRSFVWPELSDDVDRLMAAIAVARASPPEVIKGDAVDLAPHLLQQTPDGEVPVVFHSTLLTYLDRNQRAAFIQVLTDFGMARPLVWIALESPGLLADQMDLRLPRSADSSFVLTVASWQDGNREMVPLAQVDSYGRWIRSLGEAAP